MTLRSSDKLLPFSVYLADTTTYWWQVSHYSCVVVLMCVQIYSNTDSSYT